MKTITPNSQFKITSTNFWTITVNYLDLPLLSPCRCLSLANQCSLPPSILEFWIILLSNSVLPSGRCIRKSILRSPPTIISLVRMPGGTIPWPPFQLSWLRLMKWLLHSGLLRVPFNFCEIWTQACLKGSAFDLHVFLSSAPRGCC